MKRRNSGVEEPQKKKLKIITENDVKKIEEYLILNASERTVQLDQKNLDYLKRMSVDNAKKSIDILNNASSEIKSVPPYFMMIMYRHQDPTTVKPLRIKQNSQSSTQSSRKISSQNSSQSSSQLTDLSTPDSQKLLLTPPSKMTESKEIKKVTFEDEKEYSQSEISDMVVKMKEQLNHQEEIIKEMKKRILDLESKIESNDSISLLNKVSKYL